MAHKEIEAIRERAEKATKGPWFEAYNLYTETGKKDELAHILTDDIEVLAENIESHNAEFIASAREDIPTLLAEVERLTKENGEYEIALSKIAHGDTWTAHPHDIAAWALGLEIGGDAE